MKNIMTMFLACFMLLVVGLTFVPAAHAEASKTTVDSVLDAITPDDLFVGIYAGSSHSGCCYNEDHDWKSLRLSWEFGERWNAGVSYVDFVNSINKPTKGYGVFGEYDFVEDFAFIEDLGAGGSLHYQDGASRGYNADIIPLGYVYVEGRDFEKSGLVGDLLKISRLNYSYMPELGSSIPEFHSWLYELKYEF